MSIGLNALVLSSNFSPESLFPLSTIPVEEAICKILTEKFEALYFYDRPILTPSRMDLKWPSVVVSPHSPKYSAKVQMKKHFLFLRDHHRCIFCMKELNENEATREHLIPTSKGGKNTWENVGIACKTCNSEKGNSYPTGKWKPKKKIYEPTFFELIELRKKYPVIIEDKIWADFLPKWNSKIIFKDPVTGEKEIVEN